MDGSAGPDSAPNGSISATISGVRPGSRCTETLSPATGRELIQAEICCTAASMWPAVSQSASNPGDSAGMAM